MQIERCLQGAFPFSTIYVKLFVCAVISVKCVAANELTSSGTIANTTNLESKTKPRYRIILPKTVQIVFDLPEDIRTQVDWGGNCTQADWMACSNLTSWFGEKYYWDHKEKRMKEIMKIKKGMKDPELHCINEDVYCVKNFWSVTRCNILCMGRCNREILSKYDDYISYEGRCDVNKYRPITPRPWQKSKLSNGSDSQKRVDFLLCAFLIQKLVEIYSN